MNNFKTSILRVEAALIRRALRDANGSVTLASRLLGFKNHQSLQAMLSGRHRDLRVLPKQTRRKSVVKRGRKVQHHPTKGEWDKPGL